jgi:hypothetical protein
MRRQRKGSTITPARMTKVRRYKRADPGKRWRIKLFARESARRLCTEAKKMK